MRVTKLIMGGITTLLGLLILIFPAFWIKVVVVLLGLGSIAYGVYSFKITKTIFENSAYERTLIIKSLISVVIGILAVVLPLAVANAMWTIMLYILAVYLIVAAVLGFYSVTLLKDSGIERKKYIIENISLLVGAVFLFIIPAKNLGSFIIRLIGLGVLFFGGVLLAIELIQKKNTVKVEVVSEITEEEQN